jgi:FAD/FMN-containing dehydrogenase
MPAPPMPFIPASRHGQPILMATLVHTDGGEAGERAMAPFRALASPIVDRVGPTRYPEIFAGPEPGGPPPLASFRNRFADDVDRDAAAALLDAIEASTAMMAVAQLRVLGGAMARVPAEATAFAHRDAPMMVNVAAMYPPGSDRAPHEAWVNDVAAAFGPRPGAYTGFLGDEGEGRVRAAYPGATWERLAAIKARVDPGNLFRSTQNVPPAASGEEETSSAA